MHFHPVFGWCAHHHEPGLTENRDVLSGFSGPVFRLGVLQESQDSLDRLVANEADQGRIGGHARCEAIEDEDRRNLHQMTANLTHHLGQRRLALFLRRTFERGFSCDESMQRLHDRTEPVVVQLPLGLVAVRLALKLGVVRPVLEPTFCQWDVACGTHPVAESRDQGGRET